MTSEVSPAEPVVHPVAAEFDLRRLRSRAEIELRSLLDRDESFHKRMVERAPQSRSVVEGRLSLIRNDYRVEAAVTPELDSLRTRIRTTLRLVQPIDMYVRAETSPNAFCAPSKNGTRLVMCIHSGLLEILTPEELLFVMGHEIGHALLEHTKIPRIEFDDPDFSPLEVIRSRALSRRQEVSCDRVGYLACQDAAVAGSALFKVMSQIPQRWMRFDVEAFAGQFDQMADLAEVLELEDVGSTHPKMALRAKALIEFSRSRLCAEALGSAEAPLSTDEMERSTSALLAALEPDLSEIETASEQEAVNHLLLSGAMMVIAADGEVDRAELAYLESHAKVSDEMKSAMKKPAFVEKALEDLREDIWVLRNRLVLGNKVGLLRELCHVALSSRGYGQEEVQVMAKLAEALGIPEDVFNRTLTYEAEESAPEKGDADVAKRSPRSGKARAGTASSSA